MSADAALRPLAALTLLGLLACAGGPAPTSRATLPNRSVAAAPTGTVVTAAGGPTAHRRPGLAGSSQPPTRLSAGDIAALISGNTAAGTADDGQAYYAYFANDGAVEFREGAVVDTGRWRVLGDGRLCSRMASIGAGTEECYFLYRDGTTIDFDRPDGNRIGTFTVEAGNPQRR